MSNRELKERISQLESDVAQLKSDVTGLRRGVATAQVVDDGIAEIVQKEHPPERPLPSKPFPFG